MKKPVWAVIVVVVALMGRTALTQAPMGSKQAFDVATIRPSKGDSIAIYQNFTPSGLYISRNVTARHLIREAYAIRSDLQLTGGPDWIDSARFDISGKTEEERPSYRRLLQGLLAERFKLMMHTETRELPVYALVMARPDGAFGPHFRRALSCDGKYSPPGPNELRTCGAQYGPGRQSVGSGQLQNLIANLPQDLGRIVVDRTGLTDRFDWDLEWEVEQSALSIGPSIFAALQEQLGLKLEPQTAPMDVFVIDKVERPTFD